MPFKDSIWEGFACGSLWILAKEFFVILQDFAMQVSRERNISVKMLMQ